MYLVTLGKSTIPLPSKIEKSRIIVNILIRSHNVIIISPSLSFINSMVTEVTEIHYSTFVRFCPVLHVSFSIIRPRKLYIRLRLWTWRSQSLFAQLYALLFLCVRYGSFSSKIPSHYLELTLRKDDAYD